MATAFRSVSSQFSPAREAPRPSRLRAVSPAACPQPVCVALQVPVLVRAGLAALLREHGDRVEVVPASQRLRAHVDVFDPQDPRLLVPTPSIPRVAITWDTSPSADSHARDLGAVRVLPLSVGVHEFMGAIEQAYLGRGDLGHFRHSSRRRPQRPDEVLSPREEDVVRGICRGLSNDEIAAELYLSINSVKTYVRTAYRKMGVASRSQAVLWGVERGF